MKVFQLNVIHRNTCILIKGTCANKILKTLKVINCVFRTTKLNKHRLFDNHTYN